MSDKKLIVLGAGIIGLLFFFYLAFFLKESIQEGFVETPAEKKSQKEERDYSDWVTYTSRISQFQIDFPSQPKTDAKAVGVAGEDNVKAALNIFVSQLPDKTILMVKVLRFPDDYKIKDTGFQLNETMNTILNADKRNVLREIKKTDWEGYEALDFAIQNLEVRTMAKSIYNDQTIYTLVYSSPIGFFDRAVFDHFVKTFKIPEK